MSHSAFDGVDEQSFFDQVEARYVKQAPDLEQSLNIAVIGKVSAGKSSLINALLKLSRRQALEIAKVGAVSGVTRDITILKLDDKVHLIDSPGLEDVRAENSKVTQTFLEHIDIGIFVVTGSSDASQKRLLDELKAKCSTESVFVVLNKTDEWDDLDPKVLEDIVNQWKNDLGVSTIYPVCTKGYDPRSRSPKMDIRGVAQLREDIEEVLEKKGKYLLLAKHMAEKSSSAKKIILTALASVAVAAFLPGSAATITAAQCTAIASLYYIYKGKSLSAKTIMSILPAFVAETIGSSLFIFVKSFLPPTGVVDIAAAGVAVTVTLAILATVNSILASNAEIEETEVLRSTFKTYRKKANNITKGLSIQDIKDSSKWSSAITQLIGGL